MVRNNSKAYKEKKDMQCMEDNGVDPLQQCKLGDDEANDQNHDDDC